MWNRLKPPYLLLLKALSGQWRWSWNLLTRPDPALVHASLLLVLGTWLGLGLEMHSWSTVTPAPGLKQYLKNNTSSAHSSATPASQHFQLPYRISGWFTGQFRLRLLKHGGVLLLTSEMHIYIKIFRLPFSFDSLTKQAAKGVIAIAMTEPMVMEQLLRWPLWVVTTITDT